ncbi:hypothetical protein DL767_009611 [Monosporascus sp. MG133]|nr:hypothetical protein DL767_009611 [Monosporascus sp. MG133]
MDKDSKTDLLAGAPALLEDYKKQLQNIEEHRGLVSKHMDELGSDQADLDKQKAKLDKQQKWLDIRKSKFDRRNAFLDRREVELDQKREEARRLCQEPSSETSETAVVDALAEKLTDLDLQSLSEDVKVSSENPSVICEKARGRMEVDEGYLSRTGVVKKIP